MSEAVCLSRRMLLGGGAAFMALGSEAARADASPRFAPRRGVNTWPWFALTREYPAPRTDYGWPPFQEQRPVPRAVDLHRLRG